MRAAEDSLRRLQTETIDLYQLHYPDDAAPLEETLSALDALVYQGKVRAVGVSNYPAALLREAVCIGECEGFPRFNAIQPHYSLLHRAEFEHELEALCCEQEISVLPYSPLAAGFLTGKYTRAQHHPKSARTSSRIIRQLCSDEVAFVVLDEVERIAAAHEVPVGQVALAWLLARDGVTSSDHRRSLS